MQTKQDTIPDALRHWESLPDSAFVRAKVVQGLISRREFKGRWMVDFRIMYYDTTGTLNLGKGGFGIDEIAAPQIVAALSELSCCLPGGATHERKMP